MSLLCGQHSKQIKIVPMQSSAFLDRSSTLASGLFIIVRQILHQSIGCGHTNVLIIKTILIALLTVSLGYISIVLFGWNTIYIVNDPYGIILLISVICGVPLSIFGGLAVIAIFMKQNEKISKVISKIFKDD